MVDSLDDEGERFEDFVKDNTLPVAWFTKAGSVLISKVRCGLSCT